MKLVIGTRASKLALWQAEHVKSLLEQKFSVSVELKKISTKGDRIQDRSLMEIGGKGLFLKEIEDELLAGTVDLAVHSMKDVPYQLPEGLALAAILEREDPTDAFVSHNYKTFSDLPDGAKVGTSSLRRLVQLKQISPRVHFVELRGNVDTRLQKLKDGQFDAIILASAGLKRLGWEDRITEKLNIVPAVGQGAIGIECCSHKSDIIKMVEALNHQSTAQAVHIEREFSRSLEGSCSTPMGCHVHSDPQNPKNCLIRCFYADPTGSFVWQDQAKDSWEQASDTLQKLLRSLSELNKP